MDHAVHASDLDPSLDVDVVFSKVDPTNGNVGSSQDWSHRRLKLSKNQTETTEYVIVCSHDQKNNSGSTVIMTSTNINELYPLLTHV